MEFDLCLDDVTAADVDAERDLVERARHDREAFAELYRLHGPAIGNYLHRRLGDAHGAEDVLSEVFLAAMRGLGGYRHRGIAFRHWLYRIATNASNRWLRRHRRRHGPLDETSPLVDPESQPTSRDANADLVRSALQRLPLKQQSILALHHLEGLTVQQVAVVLGCRVGTVKSRLSRAREALRISLALKDKP